MGQGQVNLFVTVALFLSMSVRICYSQTVLPWTGIDLYIDRLRVGYQNLQRASNITPTYDACVNDVTTPLNSSSMTSSPVHNDLSAMWAFIHEHQPLINRTLTSANQSCDVISASIGYCNLLYRNSTTCFLPRDNDSPPTHLCLESWYVQGLLAPLLLTGRVQLLPWLQAIATVLCPAAHNFSACSTSDVTIVMMNGTNSSSVMAYHACPLPYRRVQAEDHIDEDFLKDVNNSFVYTCQPGVNSTVPVCARNTSRVDFNDSRHLFTCAYDCHSLTDTSVTRFKFIVVWARIVFVVNMLLPVIFIISCAKSGCRAALEYPSRLIVYMVSTLFLVGAYLLPHFLEIFGVQPITCNSDDSAAGSDELKRLFLAQWSAVAFQFGFAMFRWIILFVAFAWWQLVLKLDHSGMTKWYIFKVQGKFELAFFILLIVYSIVITAVKVQGQYEAYEIIRFILTFTSWGGDFSLAVDVVAMALAYPFLIDGLRRLRRIRKTSLKIRKFATAAREAQQSTEPTQGHTIRHRAENGYTNHIQNSVRIAIDTPQDYPRTDSMCSENFTPPQPQRTDYSVAGEDSQLPQRRLTGDSSVNESFPHLNRRLTGDSNICDSFQPSRRLTGDSTMSERFRPPHRRLTEESSNGQLLLTGSPPGYQFHPSGARLSAGGSGMNASTASVASSAQSKASKTSIISGLIEQDRPLATAAARRSKTTRRVNKADRTLQRLCQRYILYLVALVFSSTAEMVVRIGEKAGAFVDDEVRSRTMYAKCMTATCGDHLRCQSFQPRIKDGEFSLSVIFETCTLITAFLLCSYIFRVDAWQKRKSAHQKRKSEKRSMLEASGAVSGRYYTSVVGSAAARLSVLSEGKLTNSMPNLHRGEHHLTSPTLATSPASHGASFDRLPTLSLSPPPAFDMRSSVSAPSLSPTGPNHDEKRMSPTESSLPRASPLIPRASSVSPPPAIVIHLESDESVNLKTDTEPVSKIGDNDERDSTSSEDSSLSANFVHLLGRETTI